MEIEFDEEKRRKILDERGLDMAYDPDDDDVVWTEEMFRAAAVYKGDKLIRPATGTLKSIGRPPSVSPKKQVTLRLDPDVIEKFRATGKGWQSRITAELRNALGI